MRAYILGFLPWRMKQQMTSVEVVFNYGAVPDEAVMRGMDDLREVYGIRRIRFQEKEQTVRVEYDATRLNEDTVASLLRRAGIDVTGRVALV
jgi:copper chaperone CopZ